MCTTSSFISLDDCLFFSTVERNWSIEYVRLRKTRPHSYGAILRPVYTAISPLAETGKLSPLTASLIWIILKVICSQCDSRKKNPYYQVLLDFIFFGYVVFFTWTCCIGSVETKGDVWFRCKFIMSTITDYSVLLGKHCYLSKDRFSPLIVFNQCISLAGLCTLLIKDIMSSGSLMTNYNQWLIKKSVGLSMINHIF